MSESYMESGSSLSAACERAVALYRDMGKCIQAPAIRKVLESVIRQKSEHVAALSPFGSLPANAAVPSPATACAEPEDVLKGLVAHETAFAGVLDGLADSLSDEDARQSVKAMAEAGRKFASWAQDHLDLLAMF